MCLLRSRVLAALGPNMLALARDRACGAYPYLVTPSYVTDARAALGRRPAAGGAADGHSRHGSRGCAAGGRGTAGLSGQSGRISPQPARQGFSEPDIDDVSDRLLDGIAAWGDLDAIAARVAEYRAAGADQVVLRILGVDDFTMWRARLAEALVG